MSTKPEITVRTTHRSLDLQRPWLRLLLGSPARQRSLLRRSLNYLLVAYGSVLFVLWVFYRLLSEPASGSGVVVSVLLVWMAPAVILAPLCLFLRRLRLALILAPNALVCIATFGIFFLPRAQPLPDGSVPLRVVTYNIQIPRGEAVDSVVAVVGEIDADVIALQELSWAAAERFAAELADAYPYQALHPQDYEPAGQGILSRYPILADSYWRYDQDEWSFGHQRVELEIAGACVVFINTHPIPSYTPARGVQARSHQQTVANILERGLSEQAPNILLGDFNMSDQAIAYRRITEYYTDAYRAVGNIGPGFTFPKGPWPWLPAFVRLDYIFYGPSWQGISARVWPQSGASDHAPLLARLLPAFDELSADELAVGCGVNEVATS